MADSVKVFGQEMNKKALYFGGAAAVGILGYAWWRHSQSSGSGSTAATASSGTNIDPATGFPYGSPEDQAALAQQQGSGLGLGSGDISGIDPNTGNPGVFDPGTGTWLDTGLGTGIGNSQGVANNAEWEQQAIADLQAGGVAQSVVSSAESGLPRYLAKLTLTPAQGSAVQMAVALAGPPPNGGPFTIRIQDNPPRKPGKPETPHPRVKATAKKSLEFDWAAVHGATRYTGQLLDGSHVVRTSETPADHEWFSGLREDHEYGFRVRAHNNHGDSDWSSEIHAKTRK